MANSPSMYATQLPQPLSAAEERHLAQLIERGREAQRRQDEGRPRSGDNDLIEAASGARAQFLRANLRLVVFLANKKAVPMGMAVEDLVQEGYFGLVRAVDKFDWRRGFKFSTYAVSWIRQAMGRAVDAQSSTIRLPFYRADELRSALSRVGGDADLLSDEAAALHQLRRPLSLNAPPHNHPDEDRRFEDVIPTGLPSPEQLAVEATERERLRVLSEKALAQLSDRQRHVVEQYFGFRGDGATFAQIGADIGVCKERARQILREALDLLRQRSRPLDLPQLALPPTESPS